MTLTAPSKLTFQQKLENYAELAIKIGVGLKPGQRLLIGADVENAELVRLVAQKAYDAGARLVEAHWEDDFLTLARLKNAPEESLTEAVHVQTFALNDVAEHEDAVLWMRSTDPDLLKDIDPSRVNKAQTAMMKARAPYYGKVMVNALNWCIIAPPSKAWAQRIFPHLSPDEALEQMWDASFKIVRADVENPLEAWAQHNARLRKVREYLTQKQYSALEFKGGGTDLSVGLPEKHVWGGGSHHTTGNNAGLEFTANIPTEEVWTLPHRERVNGVARASKPLSYSGVLITDIEVHFEDGRIVSAKASKGQEVLEQMIATDEGSHRLGEVALVPHSSPISQSGLLFYNTLYDENAASHIAIGRAYRHNLEGGVEMPLEDFVTRGGNDSLVHVDWMIGSNEIDVTGVLPGGSREAVMVGGEWAFEV